jgi:hypothetical protein
VKGNVSVYVPVDAMLVSAVVVLGIAHPVQRYFLFFFMHYFGSIQALKESMFVDM